MLTMRSNNGLAREHDRQVRLHSVRTDLELDLPPRIHLPDGEEYPFGGMAKIHLRNSEQVRFTATVCVADVWKFSTWFTVWPKSPNLRVNSGLKLAFKGRIVGRLFFFFFFSHFLVLLVERIIRVFLNSLAVVQSNGIHNYKLSATGSLRPLTRIDSNIIIIIILQR